MMKNLKFEENNLSNGTNDMWMPVFIRYTYIEIVCVNNFHICYDKKIEFIIKCKYHVQSHKENILAKFIRDHTKLCMGIKFKGSFYKKSKDVCGF